MPVIHAHAKQRAAERGTTELEIIETVETGERFPAKHGRKGFRKNFEYNKVWNTTLYAVKQVEVYAVYEKNDWTVITVIVKYF